MVFAKVSAANVVTQFSEKRAQKSKPLFHHRKKGTKRMRHFRCDIQIPSLRTQRDTLATAVHSVHLHEYFLTCHFSPPLVYAFPKSTSTPTSPIHGKNYKTMRKPRNDWKFLPFKPRFFASFFRIFSGNYQIWYTDPSMSNQRYPSDHYAVWQ